MPFNTLLLGCLLISATSYGESGASVTVKPKSGETVLFFVIDDQASQGKRCDFRKNLNLQGKICDCIILYAEQNKSKKIICLVELKRGNLQDVEEKLINTYRSLEARLKPFAQQIEWKVCVLQTTGSAQDVKPAQKNLEKVFGSGRVRFSRNSDIGDFLRQ